MFAWSLRSRPANMRGMVCFANRPARPAEPGDTISLRGLRPLKLPLDLDMVCLHAGGQPAGCPFFMGFYGGVVVYFPAAVFAIFKASYRFKRG